MCKKVIVVTGMHRSGTSALTRVINLLGPNLPNDLLPPQPDNPTGFWESRTIVYTNNDALALSDSEWDSPKPCSFQWLNTKAGLKLKKKLINFLKIQKQDSTLLLKDPRFCLLIPLWDQMFEELNWIPYYVISLRPPSEVALSLQKRNHFEIKKATQLWMRYNLELEKQTRNQQRIFVKYNDLLNTWESVIQHIDQNLQLDLQPEPTQAQAINQFIRPQLNHFKSTNSETEFPVAQETYKLLSRKSAINTEQIDQLYTTLMQSC